MVLATLPPSIKIGCAQRWSISITSKPFWTEHGTSGELQSPWKSVAFSRIAALEHGIEISGVGDFRVSERAADQLRLYVNQIKLQSLPIPKVVPLSGRGIMLIWQSGSRMVEITAFADGEIVPEALEDHDVIEELSNARPEVLIGWLVKAPEVQRLHATTR